jgi:hypothetical protein
MESNSRVAAAAMRAVEVHVVAAVLSRERLAKIACSDAA